jgi:hypothetical protein
VVNSSGPVGDSFSTCHARAVGAAIEVAVGFYAMANDLDATVLAGRGEGMDGTLKTIKGARSHAGHAYLKGFIVLISTDFALGHIHLLLPGAERFTVLSINTLVQAETNARLIHVHNHFRNRCRKMSTCGRLPDSRRGGKI